MPVPILYENYPIRPVKTQTRSLQTQWPPWAIALAIVTGATVVTYVAAKIVWRD